MEILIKLYWNIPNRFRFFVGKCYLSLTSKNYVITDCEIIFFPFQRVWSNFEVKKRYVVLIHSTRKETAEKSFNFVVNRNPG